MAGFSLFSLAPLMLYFLFAKELGDALLSTYAQMASGLFLFALVVSPVAVSCFSAAAALAGGFLQHRSDVWPFSGSLMAEKPGSNTGKTGLISSLQASTERRPVCASNR